MDSLMAALVAALLIRASDPSIQLVAAIAERSGRIGPTLAGAWLAVVVTQGVAAMAGLLVAPHLTPNAAQLMLAITLLAAGASAFLPAKPLRLDGVKHPFTTSAVRLVASGMGDRSGFVIFAIAIGGTPVLAAIGGAIGGAVVIAAAAAVGETMLGQMPRQAIGIGIGSVLLVAGLWAAAAALRLI